MIQGSPFIGILMLDTSFQRVPGDVGNAKTFSYPVRYKIVKDATAQRIVTDERPGDGLVNRFIDAARQFGVMEVAGDGRIIGFEEKPERPKALAGGEALDEIDVNVRRTRTFILDSLAKSQHERPE